LLSVSRQFMGFLICSGAAAAVNFVAGSILIHGAGFTSEIGYPVAIAAGYILGMAVNFLLNRRYTFSGSVRTRLEQARTFVVVALSGLALTSIVAALTRAMLRPTLASANMTMLPFGHFLTAETLGQTIAIGAVSIYSFAGHKYLTFAGGIRVHLFKLAKLRQ
jgi:putative flippase GtrA